MSEEMKKEYEEEFIERVEKAAHKGAEKGAQKSGSRGGIISLVIILAVVIGGTYYMKYSITNKWDNFKTEILTQFSFEDPAESHDLVLEDDGVFGYTAADFAEAIITDKKQLKKIEVFEAKLADVVTVTDTGFANIKATTKKVFVTFRGTVVYTVDLSKLSEKSVLVDEESKTVTLKIPHSVKEEINIPTDDMEFSDVEKGLLAFGEIEMTLEKQKEVTKGARAKMEEKLVEDNVQEEADRFAKMTIWELYQPIITSVSPEYKLEIEFE